MAEKRVTRREAIIAGGSIALFGAVGYRLLDGGNEQNPLEQTPDSVRGAQFEWSGDTMEFTEDEQWHRTEYPDPTVAVEEQRASIRGVLYYGSSSCNKISINELSVTGSRLEITVGWKEDRSQAGHCTDDLAMGSYLLEMEVEVNEIDTLLVDAAHRAPTADDGSKIVTTSKNI